MANGIAVNETRREFRIAALLLLAFAAFYFLPVGRPRFDASVSETLELTKWYAREHVVLCLLPAFWIAGAIAAFVSQASVMRYLGPQAPKPLAYTAESTSPQSPSTLSAASSSARVRPRLTMATALPASAA